MTIRSLAIFLMSFFFAAPALADDFKLATVDYSRAIQQIEEGKAAQSRLDTMYAGQKAKIEQLEADLNALATEYQSKQAVLSPQARQEYEQRLYEKQMEYQQAYSQADYEMQAAYYSVMEQLMSGLKTVAEEIGRTESYDLILEASQGQVLFAADGSDITDKVVQQYNASHPAN